MSYVLVKIKVEDYAKWKTAFDERKAKREESGSKEAHLFRNFEDKNEVVILFDWEDLSSARKYMESDNVRKYLKNVGAEIVNVTYLDKQETSI
jgi:heme-degrading monooxygenase HmoA